MAFALLWGAGAAGCDESPAGTLEIYWMVSGQAPATGCPAAGVTRLRVLSGRMGQPPDTDLAHPSGPYADFDCVAGEAALALPEGLYRIRMVALDATGNVRSQVVERLDVEVVDGAVTRLPPNPDIESPIDIPVPICGNGVAEPGEWCDATDLGGADCKSLGYDGGTLACLGDCTLDESGCSLCGDGVINLQSGEQCDGSELGGATCQSLGLDGGRLACDASCAFDLSGCQGCGNGVPEPGEACDDGNQVGGDGCDAQCRLERVALEVSWSPETQDGTPVDCVALGVDTVQVSLLLAGQGVVVSQALQDCAVPSVQFGDLSYGLYTVRLSGLDPANAEVAAGHSPVLDLSRPDTIRVRVPLRPTP